MEDETKSNYWDELRLLQPTIDKFDDISFRIKSWFLTIYTGIAGYSIVYLHRDLIKLNFIVVGIFYIVEIAYREAQKAFLDRSAEVQKCLRGEESEDCDDSPYLDKHLPRGFCNEYGSLIKGLFLRLFQPRISFVYLFAVAVNALLFFKWNFSSP